MIKRFLRICATSLILFATLLLFANVVSAHGKVSLENDSCIRGIEGSMVHLSAYQPQYDPEAEYCTEIPHEGKTFWVIDLVDQALRDMPIAVRIVKGTGEKLSETVANFHSTYHPEGVIKGESNLDGGQYTIFVTGEGVPLVQYQYPLRVQMINYADTFRAAILPMIVLLLLAFITNKYLKSRRMQQS
ncbi:hypothetical protein [Nitrosomonas sp.]|jgi:hypothetical protein|uniref:hypothetical protein n=1 Tax=Nitrosomonas sp. TaxID=42353 RepID=UPI00207D7C9A|nr:hypothetical protein [Nitrosomonas sp.]GJL77009.1 MAG: hypothetical protein NMNS02_32020 [Nitrosomonas sp.]